MSVAVIPFAITMNAGPQIMSAIIFVTANKPLKLSAYFLGGVVIAVTVGLTVTYTLASVLGNSVSLGDSSDSGSLGNIIQYLLAGLLLLSVFPSDLVILVTVGINLAQQNASLLAAVPFMAATVFIAALPVLSYLLFRHRAQQIMPKVRDWMNTNSWLVNIIVYVIFIVLILA